MFDTSTPAGWESLVIAHLARYPAGVRNIHERCPSCRLPGQQCMCDEVETVACSVQIVIVRHVLESARNSNTGRLVACALAGAKVVEYANPMHPMHPGTLAQPGTALLYPRPGSFPLAEAPKRLLVLDASWSQARRMAQRISGLRGMPRLSLPPPERALPRMREGKSPEQMSTAESVITALHLLGEDIAAAHLEKLLRELVHRFALPRRRGAQACD